METTEVIFGAANHPDLRRFKAADGKMILYQGWADQSDIAADSIDYYETTERTMGGRAATQDFFRLFMVPGMNHCTGGAGPFAIDYLTSLGAWVERGQAPDVLIGAHVRDTNWFQSMQLKFPLKPSMPVDFTRPVYPYPLEAKYKGGGNSDDAANFVPVAPRR
jgi:feruloyl esterase